MNDERDSDLRDLFAAARQDLVEDEFTQQVMSRVDRSRGRSILLGIGIGLVFLVCAWLLTGPVVLAVNLLTDLLPRSWVELEDSLVARLFAPLNTMGALIAALVLIILVGIRKIFR